MSVKFMKWHRLPFHNLVLKRSLSFDTSRISRSSFLLKKRGVAPAYSEWRRMVSTKATSDRSEADKENTTGPRSTPISTKILYDGDCKICQVEISLLKKYTKDRSNLHFVDISGFDYDPSLFGGVSYEDAMKEMHVIGQDGKVHIQGDAIREMYRACGLGWLARFTELPVIRPVCDYLYILFAKYRLRKALERCDTGSCSIKLRNLKEKIDKSM